MDQQAITELSLAVLGILAAVFFVHMGYIGPEWGFTVILGIVATFTAYEGGRKQPQPGTEETEDRERPR